MLHDDAEVWLIIMCKFSYKKKSMKTTGWKIKLSYIYMCCPRILIKIVYLNKKDKYY